MAEKILVVDDEDIIRESLAFILKKEGFEVSEAANGKDAYEKVMEDSFDLLITDIEMPEMKGIELLEKVKKININTDVIIITAYGSMDTAINALRAGASDYILKPIEFDELLIKLRRLFNVKHLFKENQILKRELNRHYDFQNIIGQSEPIQKIYSVIETVAASDSTVLITGKSGTGKELAARALHHKSKRSDKAFVALNCGAIPENLMESELFGHKKGAFTGAVFDKDGFIKAADKGTLFLDEISEMPQQLQVKLLRVLQEREFIPVGKTQPVPIDVRFIASTNRDLKIEIKEGRFREDLFYRLNVVEINLPTLEERKEDIPLLADHFLDKYRKEMNKNVKGIDGEAMRALINHEWRGQIRELENTIERAVIFCKSGFINIEDLPESVSGESPLAGFTNFGSSTASLEKSVNEFERAYIMHILQKNELNKEKTAEVLQVGLSTLYRKLKELNIEV